MKKIVLVVICALVLLLCCGCNSYQASEDLYKEVLERNLPLTLKWFEDNMPDAKNIEGNSFAPIYRLSNDLMEGTYITNEGKKYNYCLNVDTGEFVSNEYMDLLEENIRIKVTEILPADFKYEQLSIFLEDEIVEGHLISDQSWFVSYDEAKLETYSYDAYQMTHLISNVQLEQMVNENIDQKYLVISLMVNDMPIVEEIFFNLDFIRNHSNWTIRFYNEDQSEGYVLKQDEGLNILEHYHKNADGKKETEAINQSY